MIRLISIAMSLVSVGVLLLSMQWQSQDEHVDCIEMNHYFDKRGRLVYEQVIFLERTPTTGRFQVRAWCLASDEIPTRRPIKNEETGMYQVDWYDTDQRILRKITSRLYRESWSQNDPERENKRVHPEGMRIGLVKRIEVPESVLLSNRVSILKAKE